MNLPSDAEIAALHRSEAPDDATYELIYGHCQIVWEITEQLLKVRPQPDINQDLVRVGCLLHDIGSYRLYRNGSFTADYIRHGVLGADILAQHGYSAQLQGFALRHTGSGLTKTEIIAQQLPLPHADLLPLTMEERLVAYADKFHSKKPVFNRLASYRLFSRQYGAAPLARFDALTDEFGEPALEAIAARHHQPLV